MKVTSHRSHTTKVPTHDVPTPAMIKKATEILKKKLPDHFQADGITSLVGKPTITSTNKPGIVEAKGTLDSNALWGGDEKRSFTCLIDLNKGTISQLKAK